MSKRWEGDLYTTRKGFSLITQRMADRIVELGGEVALNATVERIDRSESRVQAVHYRQDGQTKRLECAAVVNTLPIDEAIGMLQPPMDGSVQNSAHALRYRSLVFVGLLVHRERVLPSSFMYFRQHSFNRISDLAQFGFHITPEGHTLLVAEISCDVRDPVWTDDEQAKQAVLGDLIAEKLLTREQVIEIHVFRAHPRLPGLCPGL